MFNCKVQFGVLGRKKVLAVFFLAQAVCGTLSPFLFTVKTMLPPPHFCMFVSSNFPPVKLETFINSISAAGKCSTFRVGWNKNPDVSLLVYGGPKLKPDEK